MTVIDFADDIGVISFVNDVGVTIVTQDIKDIEILANEPIWEI